MERSFLFKGRSIIVREICFDIKERKLMKKYIFICRGTGQNKRANGYLRENRQSSHSHLPNVSRASRPWHSGLVPWQPASSYVASFGERRERRASYHGGNRVERCPHLEVSLFFLLTIINNIIEESIFLRNIKRQESIKNIWKKKYSTEGGNL